MLIRIVSRWSATILETFLDIQSADLLTIALLVALEGLLSADNAMVLAVLVLDLPKAQRRSALRYGIVGAFAFRTLAILLAVYLIQVAWVMLLGGAYLAWLTYSHFRRHGDAGTGGHRSAAPSSLSMMRWRPGSCWRSFVGHTTFAASQPRIGRRR